MELGVAKSPVSRASAVTEVPWFNSRQLEGLRPRDKGSLVNVVEKQLPCQPVLWYYLLLRKFC